MSSEVLNCQPRESLGTSAARRLRRAGIVPANLYGHGEDNLSLAIPREEIDTALRHGAHLVQLKGAVNDTALIREIQWNPFGTEVLHLDLTRVSVSEKVEVSLGIELRGEAPGEKEGGDVSVLMHEIALMCPAGKIPEKIEINVNELHLGESIRAADLPIPEGAELLVDPEAVVVSCQERIEVEEEEAVEGADLAAEPEVIGRPAEAEEGEESS